MDEKFLSQNGETAAKKKTPDVKDCFAQNLIKYRKAMNLTQAELAEKLNYSDKAVSKWERAESVPDIYTIKSIADFFGSKVDVLISEPKPEQKIAEPTPEEKLPPADASRFEEAHA